AETILYACSRPIPGAPGGKTRIVRFQILAAKDAVLDGAIVHQQNAAVPDIRLLPLKPVERRVDFCPSVFGKGPELRVEPKSRTAAARARWCLEHPTSASAVKTRLGFTISPCEATN